MPAFDRLSPQVTLIFCQENTKPLNSKAETISMQNEDTDNLTGNGEEATNRTAEILGFSHNYFTARLKSYEVRVN